MKPVTKLARVACSLAVLLAFAASLLLAGRTTLSTISNCTPNGNQERANDPLSNICLFPSLFANEMSIEDKTPDSLEANATVVFPPAKRVIGMAKFPVIIKGAFSKVTLDGQPLILQEVAPSIHACVQVLTPGKHILTVDGIKHEFTVSNSKETETIVFSHPVAALKQCYSCHNAAKKECDTEFGTVSLPDRCLECHGTIDFEAIHSHPLEPLEHCNDCHGIHGGGKKLLLGPIRRLCVKCHES